jgi:hypothetical protein
MISHPKYRKRYISRPFCQATGCFEQADVYIVLKESEEPVYCNSFAYEEPFKDNNIHKIKNKEEFQEEDEKSEFDGFKLILYLCNRHDMDFKYLIKGSELQISKRCSLNVTTSMIKSH